MTLQLQQPAPTPQMASLYTVLSREASIAVFDLGSDVGKAQVEKVLHKFPGHDMGNRLDPWQNSRRIWFCSQVPGDFQEGIGPGLLDCGELKRKEKSAWLKTYGCRQLRRTCSSWSPSGFI